MIRSFLVCFIIFKSQLCWSGVLLQGFYWDAPSSWDSAWWERLSGEAQSLSQAGFTAIWLPPVLKGASGGYSNGYDPYDDYDMGSKDQRGTVGTHWGTREQLQKTIAVMRANGLDVYVDTVLGHRNGDDGFGNFVYKNAQGEAQGGRFEKTAADFFGWNDFGRQLNYNNQDTREHLISAGNWLIQSLGVQGLRIDMAKNIQPHFLLNYMNRDAMSGKFAVSEYWSENLYELEDYVANKMQSRVSAFDFPLWGLLKDMANNSGYFDMRRLQGAGLVARLPNHSVTFVENHDTDRFYPVLRNKHLAYAYILTSEGYPSVFWKDYFNYGLKNVIDPLIWIHEKLASGSTEWRSADDDLLIYERTGGRRLLVGLNDNQIYEKKQWVKTGFPGYTVLHDYSGNSFDVRTEADGSVEVAVPANSFVAYAPIGESEAHILKTYSVTQQFFGAMDLDIPAASVLKEISVGRVWVDTNSSIEWTLYTPSTFSNEDKLEVSILTPMNAVMERVSIFSTSEPFHQSTQTNIAGFYEFKMKLVSPKNNFELPYWLKVTYRAPVTKK